MGKSTLTDYINDSELLVWCDTLLKFRILSYTFRFTCLKQEEYLHAKSFAQGFSFRHNVCEFCLILGAKLDHIFERRHIITPSFHLGLL